MWPGQSKNTTSNVEIHAEFVTAMLKGKAGQFAIKGGDAQTRHLKTMFEGPRPGGYHTMKKQGAIILGTGGDNSNWGVGTWFEGAIVSGYSSDEVDNEIQASIADARYSRDLLLMV
mmetsp:Transcript_33407/g.49659  ORF Transcript_33407/g.49659 Transcript_33407/m.49659 type:complete len:116 (-) Transcript_33407:345-692(-)